MLYVPRGVCARSIEIDLHEDGHIREVSFTGGCNGNLNAISKLVVDHPAEEIAALLEGNDCAGRGTSCADQLSKALRIALDDQKSK